MILYVEMFSLFVASVLTEERGSNYLFTVLNRNLLEFHIQSVFFFIANFNSQ